MDNKIFSRLSSLGLVEKDAVKEIHPRLRDRDDISVLQDQSSDVIFLSRSDHVDRAYYEDQDGLKYWTAKDRDEAKRYVEEDDRRRFAQFYDSINGKKWLDFGTGAGGILDLFRESFQEIYAIEPQRCIRQELLNEGYHVYPDIDNCDQNDFDVVTLFHVLEHLTEPVNALRKIHNKMRPKGKIIVEVPHAKDFLIANLNLKCFKDFTFWSEHLILHTHKSLRTFLEKSGFKDVKVSGFQRYAFINHLHWIIKGKPGGHKVWARYHFRGMDAMYKMFLKSIKRTDTLIAVGYK